MWQKSGGELITPVMVWVHHRGLRDGHPLCLYSFKTPKTKEEFVICPTNKFKSHKNEHVTENIKEVVIKFWSEFATSSGEKISSKSASTRKSAPWLQFC